MLRACWIEGRTSNETAMANETRFSRKTSKRALLPAAWFSIWVFVVPVALGISTRLTH
jgi:hypothetical protein